jgi:hypothetical protein
MQTDSNKNVIPMTKSAYKKLCFEEKIPNSILEKYDFLPEPAEPIDLTWLENKSVESKIEMVVDGDVEGRKLTKNHENCRYFRWYLGHIWDCTNENAENVSEICCDKWEPKDEIGGDNK